MTVLDHSPRAPWTPRPRRRLEIVTTGGMQGVLDVGAALGACGCPVSDFVADVRDGVVYSSVTCTVSLAEAEREAFERRMTALPAVVSVEPC